MSTLNFSLPGNSDSYQTGILQTLKEQVAALAKFCQDDLDTLSNIPTGAKRYNHTTQLFERRTAGGSWEEMPLAYIKTAQQLDAAAILTALETVDGHTSGLDADLLDGQEGSYYTAIAARLGYTPANKAGDTFTGAMLFGPSGIASLATNGDITATRSGGTTGFVYLNSAGTRYLSWSGTEYQLAAAQLYINGQVAWNAGNDGSTSGLDADYLDGQHGSYYLNAANHTGTIASARLSGSYTGITAVGTLTSLTINGGNLVANEGYSAGQRAIQLEGGDYTYYGIKNNARAADNRTWLTMGFNDGSYQVLAYNDALTAFSSGLIISRSGITITGVTVPTLYVTHQSWQTSTSFTLDWPQVGKPLGCQGTGNIVTVTIPADSTRNFNVGTSFYFFTGAGTGGAFTIAKAAGVTLYYADQPRVTVTTSASRTVLMLIKNWANEWTVCLLAGSVSTT